MNFGYMNTLEFIATTEKHEQFFLPEVDLFHRPKLPRSRGTTSYALKSSESFVCSCQLEDLKPYFVSNLIIFFLLNFPLQLHQTLCRNNLMSISVYITKKTFLYSYQLLLVYSSDPLNLNRYMKKFEFFTIRNFVRSGRSNGHYSSRKSYHQ